MNIITQIAGLILFTALAPLARATTVPTNEALAQESTLIVCGKVIRVEDGPPVKSDDDRETQILTVKINSFRKGKIDAKEIAIFYPLKSAREGGGYLPSMLKNLSGSTKLFYLKNKDADAATAHWIPADAWFGIKNCSGS